MSSHHGVRIRGAGVGSPRPTLPGAREMERRKNAGGAATRTGVARSACFRSTMFSTCSLSHFMFLGGNEDCSQLARAGRFFKVEYGLGRWMVENELALPCLRPLWEGTAPKSAFELRWQKPLGAFPVVRALVSLSTSPTRGSRVESSPGAGAAPQRRDHNAPLDIMPSCVLGV
jgi:hypothetical protein